MFVAISIYILRNCLFLGMQKIVFRKWFAYIETLNMRHKTYHFFVQTHITIKSGEPSVSIEVRVFGLMWCFHRTLILSVMLFLTCLL